MQGGNALLPAGGLAVERCLKEGVSKRGHRTGCPPHQPARIVKRAVSSQRRYHKGNARYVPRFRYESASGGKGAWPP
ncbi:hypothetical protein VT03_16430 [Planctomyces sp. SH-PL14]|nr:hypothetical protein VT03_16430 [Planctomyces sp. SH-PL14]